MFPTGLAGNAFVTKFDSSGHVVYSTFVGTYGTEGTAIAVDPQGQAAINAPAASLMTQATACTGQPAITVLNAAGSAVAAFSSITGKYLAMDRKGGFIRRAQQERWHFSRPLTRFRLGTAGAMWMVPQEK
jgi:hypothetical protein